MKNVLLLTAFLLAFGMTHAQIFDTITVSPSADSYVRGGANAGNNYGTEDSLAVKTYNTNPDFSRNTYLKFPVTNANITGAKLRVYGANLSSSATLTLTVSAVTTDSWTETGITWTNAPAAAFTIGTLPVNNVVKYYDLDVSSFVLAQAGGDQVVTFLIKDTANKNLVASFDSRENATNKPQLVIYTETAASGSSWSTGGNSGTTASSNYVGTSDNVDLVFRTNNTEKMRLSANGRLKVGSGTDNGKSLQVFGTGFFNGAVGIGTDSIAGSGYKLFVAEGIRTRKVKVDVTAWPDYVFHHSYKLPSLTEVEKYISENKHLPEIISAEKAEQEGINLGENQAALLRKIEELTLYMIEHNKTLSSLQQIIEQQQQQINDLKKALQTYGQCN